MRAEDFPKPRRGPTTGPGGGSDDALASGDSSVTSRGMKYWTTGAIPLIAPDVLGDIIATASDIAIVISDVGQVLSVLVNPAHPNADTLETWEGRDIRDLLTVESVPKLDAQLDRFNTGEDLGRSIELNHSDNANWEINKKKKKKKRKKKNKKKKKKKECFKNGLHGCQRLTQDGV
eukprot:TRINITY_DN16234_c1_g1_i1.p2 TRINITY_DN16234_c1_g1~~TRINITY_DN16234_c1_g1_i1.p2  ORF type:complete len:176 (-),score=26.31 TRINITY_DN16234_c1_g1_i1:31-558(-)